MAIKFLKNGIRSNGTYHPVWYSMGYLIGFPEDTITIYARTFKSLPKELNPVNNSDFQTDYVEKDRVRVVPGSKYYDEVLKAYKKNKH